MIGVCPFGAQVRRTGGVSEMPDSSWKTSHALRRRAFFYPGPAGGDPLVDGVVVALERSTSRALGAPAELSHDPPYVARVIGDTGECCDDFADPRQRPDVRGEPRGSRTTSQNLLHRAQVRTIEQRPSTGASCTFQFLHPTTRPRLVPPAHALTRDVEFSGDVGLGDALGEQLGRLFSPGLHAFEVPLGWPCFDHATLSHGWRRMSLYYASLSKPKRKGKSD